MEKFATENLILLEFLVEAVSFDYNHRNDLQVMNGETLVSFQFLDNAPLLVSEEEFLPKCADMCPGQNKSNVKHGKSCLFSLTPAQAADALKKFDIFVEIFKKMKPGMLPEKIKIGEALISIVNIFTELMDAIIKHQETTSAKILKDNFKILNLQGESIGKIRVFVRVSCFGKLIVTQFQMNLDNKSVEFKAKEGHYMFKYQRKDGRCSSDLCLEDSSPPICCSTPTEEMSRDCPSNYPTFPSCIAPPSTPQSTPRRSTSAPINPSDYPPFCPASCCYSPPSYCSQPPSCCSPPTCCLPASCCLQPSFCSPPSCTPCPSLPYSCQDQFQEIGASMGKNAVTIRVRKETSVEPWNGVSEDSEEEEEERCCLDYSKKRRVKSACPKSKSNKFRKQPRSSSVPKCVPPRNSDPQSCPLPTCPPPRCSCANSSSTSAPLRTISYPTCPPTPALCFPPPCCGCAPTCPTSHPLIRQKCDDDPEKETFILKIGKKNENYCCKQNDLELEVCTPKGKDIKPPPQMQSRDAQYSLLDIPTEYLEAFYGKDKWRMMKKQQDEEEARLAKLYGAYAIGESSLLAKMLGKKKKSKKGGKGDGDAKGRSGGGFGGGVFIEKEVCVPCEPCDPCDPCNPCVPCNPCNPCNPCYPCDPCGNYATCNSLSTCCYR